ncbi:uncharacterized protein VP01_6872g1, partial [Puccinia sorghi]
GPAQHPLDSNLKVDGDVPPLIFKVLLNEDPTQLFLKLLQTLKQPSRSGQKFCTPGMKPPDKFDGENSLKLQGFLQSCKLLFLNENTVFSDDFKKVLYAASYLGRWASQWFKPYLELLEN